MRMAARVALVAWLGVVFAITLSPHNNATLASGDRAVASARRHVDIPGTLPRRLEARETDFIGNVLLFVPLGFLGLLAFPERTRTVAVAGPLLSGSIETFQMGYLPHRVASVHDVVTNSTGLFLGMATALVVLRVMRRGRRRGGA